MAKPKVGEVFEKRYEILEEIGSGGSASVFRARQLDVKRDVALKFLHTGAIADDETISRFYREFKLLSRLSHPHIVTIYGMSIDSESEPYAIFEYIKGTNLSETLKASGAMNWQRVLHIANQICQALQFAHKNGIVHRDLKPDNIMIEERLEPDYVKLVDFGLSHVTMQIPSIIQKLTSTGKIIGSPSYMSPEQVSGRADERSDIYALGCVMFEMLSGQRLFKGDSTVSTLFKQANEDPLQHFPAIKQEMPRELFNLLAGMLDKAPEKRPQSMKVLAAKLEEILDNADSLIVGSNYKPQKSKKPLRLNKRVIAGSLAGFALLVLFADLALFSQREKGKKSALAFQSLQKVSPAKHIHDLLERSDLGDYHLRIAKAYRIASQSNDRMISLTDRWELDVRYAELLYDWGLNRMVFDLDDKTQSKKTGQRFTRKSSLNTEASSFRDYELQLLYARIWNNLGNKEKCMAALRQSLKGYFNSGVLELALEINDKEIQQKCIERCHFNSDISNGAECFRRHNKLKEAEELLSHYNPNESFSSERHLAIRYDLERACLLFASSKPKECVALLQAISTDQMSELKLGKKFAFNACERLLSLTGENSRAVKPLLGSDTLALDDDEALAEKTTDELLATKKSFFSEKESAILAQRALSSKDKLERARIFCAIADKSPYGARDCYGARAYNACQESKTPVPRDLMLRSTQLYAEALYHMGFPALAIPHYRKLVEDLEKNGFPPQQRCIFVYSDSGLDWALVVLSHAYLDIGDKKNGEKFFAKLVKKINQDTPNIEALSLAFKLHRLESFDQIIEHCNWIGGYRQILIICCQHNRFDLAENCLQKAKEWAERVQQAPADSNTPNPDTVNAKLAVAESLLRLAKGDEPAAKKAILSSLEQYKQLKPGVFDPELSQDLALLLGMLGFENQSEEIESDYTKQAKEHGFSFSAR